MSQEKEKRQQTRPHRKPPGTGAAAKRNGTAWVVIAQPVATEKAKTGRGKAKTERK